MSVNVAKDNNLKRKPRASVPLFGSLRFAVRASNSAISSKKIQVLKSKTHALEKELLEARKTIEKQTHVINSLSHENSRLHDENQDIQAKMKSVDTFTKNLINKVTDFLPEVVPPFGEKELGLRSSISDLSPSK